MEIKVGIIDDEADARKLVKNLLQIYCPHLQIVGEADTVQLANGDQVEISRRRKQEFLERLM